MYRILHHHHYRTGDQWCIYPMYDFAHGQGDAIEGVTHSLCSLEFENHRPLYNWYIENLPVPSKPRQIEFSRLNLTQTVMSKRKLLRLVEEGHVSGWDDPRMPTLSGYRRRGYTPEAIREFARRVGVTKQNQVVDVALLEFCLRQDLEAKATRRLAVLDPIKVTLTNFPADTVEWYEGPNHPGNPAHGVRKVPPDPRNLYRAGRLHGGSSPKVLSTGPRAGKSACVTPATLQPMNSRSTGTERSLKSWPNSIPPPAAAPPPTAAR